ncbi:MAG: nitrilase-related carbon-nitrogen hydrolase [Wujia sp.]
MRLALAQTNIIWEDKQANLKHVEDILRSIAGRSQLVLFPEMSLTGFSMNTAATADTDRDTVSEIEQLSKKYNISIGIGWVKQGDSLAENHYSVMTPDGGEVSDYVKLHPFSYSGEDRLFVGGDRLVSFSLCDFSISTAICYDLRFPEIFQIMSEKSELIIVPANWPSKRREHWMTLLKARAIENQCYIAGINCCGKVGELDYSGDSDLYNPDGKALEPDDVINTGIIPDEKVLIYDICNDVDSFRNSFPVKRDRRCKLYANCTI